MVPQAIGISLRNTYWLRNPGKIYKNGSIGCKAMVLAYPLVGQWIGWKIGNRRQVRVGEDPWTGVGENFKFYPRFLLWNPK